MSQGQPKGATQSSAPPSGGEQPRAGELFLAAAMVTLVAGLVLWGAISSEREVLLDLGTVTAENALDAKAVPSGAFLTVVGKVDPTRVATLYGMGPGTEQDVLLVLRDTPHLILHCRAKHPLAKAVHRRRPCPKGELIAAELEQTWHLSGRLCDADKYTDPQFGTSGMTIQQLAVERLGVSEGEAVRILAVGTTPADLHRSAQTAVLFGVGMTLVAIVLWALAIHGLVQKREEAKT